ncbi:MAG: DUF4823 domain-containing protein [Francisellaceae bacterium]
MSHKNWMMLLVVLMLSGCATQPENINNTMADTVAKQDENIHFVGGQAIKIAPDSSVYIAYPNDGADDYHYYEGSGAEVLNVITTSLSPYFSKMMPAKSYQHARSAYMQARSEGYQYFILPHLKSWTDSYTMFTGVPDKVVLDLKIYDLITNQLLDQVEIKSISSVMPGFEKNPDELLGEAMNKLTARLFLKKG